MSARESDRIHDLLTRLMDGLRTRVDLRAEIARAEREFFHANPDALRIDPSAPVRFQEWYLLERESEVLGEVPVQCLAMTEDERESLSDSVVGVFQVTGASAAEYAIRDLWDDAIHDLERDGEIELAPGDVVIGRLYVGSLDVFVPSVALACQRAAGALAAAFRKDLANLELGRRLTQSELEHLLFRGRSEGRPAGEAEPAGRVPLERLEAELEASLHAGGVENVSVTGISNALRNAPRPGLVTGPLLEKIAFDSEADLEAVRRALLLIWSHHHRVPATDPAPGHTAELPADPAVGATAPAANSRGADPVRDRDDAAGDLGVEVARRIAAGVENREDMAQVFAEIERMVEMDPDPVGFRPDAVDLAAEPPAGPAMTGGGEGLADYDGDLRPLMTEFLWETGGDAGDIELLEELFRNQCESSVPRLDLEAITRVDLLRLLLRKYLESAPGTRAATVGRSFAVLEKFYRWVEHTQLYELGEVREGVRSDLVDQVARLETASLKLSEAAAGDLGGDCPRRIFRVVELAETWMDVAADEDNELHRVGICSLSAQNLRPEDLLLGSLQTGSGGTGSFAGMVIALPAVAIQLLG